MSCDSYSGFCFIILLFSVYSLNYCTQILAEISGFEGSLDQAHAMTFNRETEHCRAEIYGLSLSHAARQGLVFEIRCSVQNAMSAPTIPFLAHLFEFIL